jgi:hypothetical protein
VLLAHCARWELRPGKILQLVRKQVDYRLIKEEARKVEKTLLAIFDFPDASR